MIVITFRKQEDGTFAKEPNADAPAFQSYKLQIRDQDPFGSYTLAQATKIVEDAIAKKQVKHDAYFIHGSEETLKEAATSEPKAAKVKKASKKAEKTTASAETSDASAPAEKKERKSKLDEAKVIELYAGGAGMKVGKIAKELGASYMGVRLLLIRKGVFAQEAAVETPAAA